MRGVVIFCFLASTQVLISHGRMHGCSDVYAEMEVIFRSCQDEKSCSEGISSRLGYCFPDRSWMTAIWTPITSKQHACYFCQPSSPCGCYAGKYESKNFEFLVASSDCKGIRDIRNLPTKYVDACTVKDMIRFAYKVQLPGVSTPLCSSGAVRYNIGRYSGVWVSGSKDIGDCLRTRTASNDDVYLWAFR